MRLSRSLVLLALLLAPGLALGRTQEDAEVPAAPSPSAPVASSAAPVATVAPAPVPGVEAPGAAPSAAPASSVGLPHGTSIQVATPGVKSPVFGDGTRADVEPSGLWNAAHTLPTLGQGFVLQAYVQGQIETHQDSQNEVSQSGQLLNLDRMSLRRGRLRLDREGQYSGLTLEIDATTNQVQGAGLNVRRAEASLLYRPQEQPNAPPLVRLTAGLFNTAFGYELLESPRVRWFMERSVASRSLFPGEPDVGVRLSGAHGFARYQVALTGGEPLDQSNGLGGKAPLSAKQLTARIGAVHAVSGWLRAAGGVSVLRGKGMRSGRPATKDGVQWQDTNEDGAIQSSELTAAPGRAATPSLSYDRWAIGADLQLRARNVFGQMQIFAEVVVASNLDRGLFAADPIQAGHDLRELGYHLSVTQEVTPYGLIGFRYEYYDPNGDALDARQGRPVPSSQTMRVYSPLVGLVLPGHGKLLFQVDFIQDFLARNPQGVPVDLRNDTATLRLQVEL